MEWGEKKVGYIHSTLTSPKRLEWFSGATSLPVIFFFSAVILNGKHRFHQQQFIGMALSESSFSEQSSEKREPFGAPEQLLSIHLGKKYYFFFS